MHAAWEPGSWDRLDTWKYQDEAEAVAGLLHRAPLDAEARHAISRRAAQLVEAVRLTARRQGVVESFLQEFSLSTPEGLALMGLAEALLRTPDTASRDKLIAEKITGAHWADHLGESDNLLVNASTWGLMLTGRLIDVSGLDGAGTLRRLAARVSEPILRAAIAQAMRIMGEEFVLGRTITEALARAANENLLCSFDMLGEGARTAADAARYENAYAHAIAAIGPAANGPEQSHGISVKLSALSHRYEPLQEARVWDELYPRLLRLAEAAAAANINFTLDAEEADRLLLSLKLLERLVQEPALKEWRGLGLAVQAYQKRASRVVAALQDLAQNNGRRLMVRLVKGAYWDSEIKRAQVAGRPDYPVFTTKAATDLCYLTCAKALLQARPHLYPQFATHNAHTLVAVKALAGDGPLEFQRLHGMGESLYAAAGHLLGPLALRTYAPVGTHEDLLPYLVRRLLENGANTSFVHRLLDDETSAAQVVADPIAAVLAQPDRNPRIPAPPNIFPDRRNSLGPDLAIATAREELTATLNALPQLQAFSIVGGEARAETAVEAVCSPFSREILGHTAEASPAQIDAAFAAAAAAQAEWDGKGGAGRAQILCQMADGLEQERNRLAALMVREAGKTWSDAANEVREAADFCRYYALLAERHFSAAAVLKGPVGESNCLELHGRGVFACISPWNFPLSIFTGQVAAALAAGNSVVAKPAEQTPLIAAVAVQLFQAAGLPATVLHLLPGRGESVGARLIEHPLLSGVAFTGGTDTARLINAKLAARPGPLLPFIAETGGLNAMFVDSTAQREQVIDDVILSAFGSAGQRCSALRLLFLPEETADSLIEGLSGAMDALNLGDPADFATDIGPVIDADARAALERYRAGIVASARSIKQMSAPAAELIFPPLLVEIGVEQLPDREVFGPILHVVRYRGSELERVAQAVARKGYGLTLGIHSRLESFANKIRALVPAGNVYINRSIIGAVVGVQPFGGEGLSGTGPKAGGPYALTPFAVERCVSTNIAAQGGDPALLNL
ncbi:MAG: bifunctional proline dehydrogenase/L-glutamate gamma-semialdehyde dehydrogenase PutA [Alphaproteobacteria bacterium]|nr:bifunctional proline dehydrogenase/L-glutamate gamma-semialdehyde dehydrogenase PutA [Alphaproteobacteria bacterium]